MMTLGAPPTKNNSYSPPIVESRSCNRPTTSRAAFTLTLPPPLPTVRVLESMKLVFALGFLGHIFGCMWYLAGAASQVAVGETVILMAPPCLSLLKHLLKVEGGAIK